MSLANQQQTCLPTPGSVYLEIQLLTLVKAMPPSCQSISGRSQQITFDEQNATWLRMNMHTLGTPLYQRSRFTLQELIFFLQK